MVQIYNPNVAVKQILIDVKNIESDWEIKNNWNDNDVYG